MPRNWRLGDVGVVAAQLLLRLQLHAEVGELALAALAVLAGAVFAAVHGALRAAPDILAHAAVDLVLRFSALGHSRPQLVEFAWFRGNAPSCCPGTCRNRQVLCQSGRHGPRVAKRRAGKNRRGARVLGGKAQGVKPPAAARRSAGASPKPCSAALKSRARGLARGEDRGRQVRACVLAGRGPDQFDHAARDRGRRIDPAHRPWREALEAVAAAADNACRRARWCRCAPRRPRRNRARSRRGSPRRRPARRRATLRRARRARPDPTSVRSQPSPKLRISAWVYSRATVASVPSTETSFDCEAAQAGLIAGTVPTKGSAKRARSAGSTSVEAVLQAMTTRSGRCVSIRSFHQAGDAFDQRGFGNLAVGKQRVVRRVDETRIGARARDLAEHGQPADAGIEHQDFRCGHDDGARSRGR